ncbi:MAG TPA: hypothetical protein ENH82_03595 [bacterium]|nr:hypothetical protein [bacterium]
MRDGILLLTIFILVCIPISAEIEKVDNSKIIGSWINNHNFYYTFDEKGVMKVINLDSNPVYYNTYRYEVISMGLKEFIRYGKDLSDSTSVELILMSDVLDSTAVFAYGKTFVRAETGKGLLGSWKYVDDLTIISWDIDKETIEYRQTELDFTTGELKPIEEHFGTYIRKNRKENAGRFYIDFQDGKKTVILPILYKDIMYIFDVNPSWSTFNLAEKTPTYKDYKQALNLK